MKGVLALGSSVGSKLDQVFNPEELLSLIIDKIKDYNKLAAGKKLGETSSSTTTQSKEDIEGIYIGLIQLTGKIIDNFDISVSERVVEAKNLIDEIFVNFLFSSVFEHQKQ